jgi:hypothetical protein
MIIEHMNLKILNDLSIEEQEEKERKKRKLHQRIVAYFREGEWECENDDCCLKFTDIDKFINHLNIHGEYNVDMTEVSTYIEPYRKYIPNHLNCKMCGKHFQTKNLLNQHINRGVKYSCSKKAFKTLSADLSIDEMMLVINYIKSIKS